MSVPGASVRPCSFAQERFWFIDQVAGRSGAYNIAWPLRLRGELDLPALERALTEVIRRHEVLRTRYVEQDGRPLQVIEQPEPIALVPIDLSASPDPEVESRRILAEHAQAPFALTVGPLCRVVLIRLAADDHILQAVVHHIAADAWSKTIFFDELSTLYGAYRENRPAALADPPVQYADFAKWQRSVLQGERVERDLDYWRQALDGIPEALEMPTDRARPEQATLRGGWLRTAVPPATLDGLNAVARAESATLFTVLLAAFDVFLYRYTGEGDVVVGSAVDTRNQPALERVIGPFVNTLVLRADLSGAPTFRELLRRCKRRTFEAIEHQQLPFERLVEELAPGRDLGRHPLFQALIALSPPDPEIRLLDLEVEELETEKGDARVDLTLLLQQRERGLDAVWEYSSDLFDRASVERMARHFLQLLDSVVADPDCRIDQLAMLSHGERDALLATLNAAEESFEVFCLHERFETGARENPDAIAVAYGDACLSYRELNERANRLAHRLRTLGVQPDGLVALCLERSPELVVAIVAVLKAGGAYVPLDPAYPPERLAFVLEDCAAGLVVTQEHLLERLPDDAAIAVCVDRDASAIAAEPSHDLPAAASPENLAYVIYTSGSTGRPKGVLVEHRMVARLFGATDAWFTPGPGDTWTLLHSYAFDFSVWELWGALLHGGRLVIVPQWTARSPEALAGLLAHERVTVLNVTPSLFTTAMDDLLAVADELSLRLVIFGGEALQTRLLSPWFDRFAEDGPELVNMYGITETTVHVTYRPLSAADSARDGSPIGRPIPDLKLYLLDTNLAPVPEGVAGELFVGGAGVARGYLNRPELTAERFIANPFGPGRLYRSGDRARWRRDRGLIFEGRMDDQVKIRGFRVELGEVQAALASHEAVAECAVVPIGRDADVALAAYVVPDEKHAGVVRRLARLERADRISPDQLRELPGGMIVAHSNRRETDFLYEEIFVADSYLRHGIVVPEDACVFDVGANIGMFSLRVAAACSSARIYAFEPIPPTFELLRANVELYGVNAVLSDCGLAGGETGAMFAHHPHNSLISGRVLGTEAATEDVQHEPDEEVIGGRIAPEMFARPLTTISRVIEESGVDRIDLLKIDAEGSEGVILAGIEDRDWPKIQQLVIEVHGSPDDLAADLRGRGFTVTVDRDELYARRGDLAPARPVGARGWQSPAALASQLRDRLRSRLPDHMIPSSFTFLDALPLTANGKLDRRALPAPRDDRSETPSAAQPRTDTERELVELWQELLGVDHVGIEEDFFDLGGHSLLAARLAARVRARFAPEFSVRTVFEAPTIARLAARLERTELADGPTSAVSITRRAADQRWPLSTSQRQLWLIDQWDPGAPTYNVSLAFRLRGPVDEQALRNALAGVADRHEPLRTVVRVENDQPVPVLLEDPPVELAVVNGDSDFEAPVRREHDPLLIIRKLARRPFDFSRDPLLRASLVRIADDDRILLLETHHIVFDGWSVRVLLAELAELYQGHVLPELPLRFADYAQWEHDWLSSDAAEDELAWWRRQLAGAPTWIELPTDHPRPGGPRFSGAVHDVSFSGQTAVAVRDVCRTEGTTPYMVTLAALSTLLYRITGQDDILIGSPVANRPSPELESLIGFFSNTLVFRARMDGNPSFRELLQRVRDMALDVYSHQSVPFEKIVQAAAPKREPGVNPLFQVNLRVGTAARPVLALPGVTVSSLKVDNGLARFDLALDVDVLEDGIAGYFRYNSDTFEQSTVARLADDFARLLEEALADPDRRLLSFEVAPDWSGPRPAAGGLGGFRARGRISTT